MHLEACRICSVRSGKKKVVQKFMKRVDVICYTYELMEKHMSPVERNSTRMVQVVSAQ